jgi:hypothetical protein
MKELSVDILLRVVILAVVVDVVIGVIFVSLAIYFYVYFFRILLTRIENKSCKNFIKTI